MRSSVVAALVTFGLAAPLQGQGMTPAANEEFLTAARSCAAATSPTAVDPRKLEADGWKKATMSSNGKPVATPLTMYGKGHLLLMFDAAGTSPLCIVTGRLGSIGEFPKLQAAFAAAYGAPIKDDGKGEQMFVAPDHRIVDLAATGSADRPAVRVGVGPVFQETK